MSQLILETINNMKQVAATKNRTGNISGWYFEWKNIKLEIIGKLNKDERDELKLLEKKIEYRLKYPSLAVKFIEEYIIGIQDLIELYHIGLAGQEDQTVFA